MIRPFFRVVIALIIASPLPLWALGLGQLEVRSALNQRLDAELELIAERADLIGLNVELASGRAFAQAGLERPGWLNELRFKVETRPDGKSVIKITSRRPIREPLFNFLIEVTWPKGRLMREVGVLLDPSPSVSRLSPQQMAVAASITRLDEAEVGNEVYGPVARGETLWGITRQLNPSVNLQAFMEAVLRANPQAFSRRNVNSLMAGTVLRIPSEAEVKSGNIRQIPPARTARTAARPTVRRPPAPGDPTPPVVEPDRVQLLPPDDDATSAPVAMRAVAPTPTPVAPAARITLEGGQPQLRVASLDQLRSRIAALAKVDSATLSAIQDSQPAVLPPSTTDSAFPAATPSTLPLDVSLPTRPTTPLPNPSPRLAESLPSLPTKISPPLPVETATETAIAARDPVVSTPTPPAALPTLERLPELPTAASSETTLQADRPLLSNGELSKRTTEGLTATPSIPIETHSDTPGKTSPETFLPVISPPEPLTGSETPSERLPETAAVQEQDPFAAAAFIKAITPEEPVAQEPRSTTPTDLAMLTPVQPLADRDPLPTSTPTTTPSPKNTPSSPDPTPSAVSPPPASSGLFSELLTNPVAWVLLGFAGLLAISIPLLMRRPARADEEQAFAAEALALQSVTGADLIEEPPTAQPTTERVTGRSRGRARPITPRATTNPLERIELLMAIGNLLEAENVARTALNKDAYNSEIAFKLLDIHARNNNSDAFIDDAKTLREHLEEHDPMWQQVVRWSQQVAPGHPLFRHAGDGEADKPTQRSPHKPMPGAQVVSLDKVRSARAGTNTAEDDFTALDFDIFTKPAPTQAEQSDDPITTRTSSKLEGVHWDLPDLEPPTKAIPLEEAPPYKTASDTSVLLEPDSILKSIDFGSILDTKIPSLSDNMLGDPLKGLDFNLDEGTNKRTALTSRSEVIIPDAVPPAEDYIEAKLDLAVAYIDLGGDDKDNLNSAKGLLQDVIREGNADQKLRAKSLLTKLPS